MPTSQPIDIHEGPGSSGFSYYGTSPESPDGRRLTYVIYQPDGSEELSICDHDLSEHRKLVVRLEDTLPQSLRAGKTRLLPRSRIAIIEVVTADRD